MFCLVTIYQVQNTSCNIFLQFLNPHELCKSDHGEFFVIPNDLETKFRDAMDAICNVNYTTIGTGLGDLFGNLAVSTC